MSAGDDDTYRRTVPPREAALRVVEILSRAGFEALFAGGCVRDRLMGQEPTDYDVATDARPEQVGDLFRRVQAVGESFGVMLVRLMGHTIEVATFRTDGVYSDGRHPDEVTFTDAQHDAERRDFTINGLFEDPLENRVIDFVGGREDLEARVLRAIGDPEARLTEDRLRMLRAVRFAARFGFAIDPLTADAIRAGAHELSGVSRERIGQEVRRMMVDANRAVAAWELQYLGLDRAVLDEPGVLNAPSMLGRLPEHATYPTALAAWLHDREPQETEVERLERARRWALMLMLSNRERDALIAVLAAFEAVRDHWSDAGVAAQKRLAASSGFDPALMLLQSTDRPAFIDVRRRVAELARTGLSPDRLLTGDDLVRAGWEPGPAFRDVLEAVYDAQLEGGVTDRDGALALATALARNTGS